MLQVIPDLQFRSKISRMRLNCMWRSQSIFTENLRCWFVRTGYRGHTTLKMAQKNESQTLNQRKEKMFGIFRSQSGSVLFISNHIQSKFSGEKRTTGGWYVTNWIWATSQSAYQKRLNERRKVLKKWWDEEFSCFGGEFPNKRRLNFNVMPKLGTGGYIALNCAWASKIN